MRMGRNSCAPSRSSRMATVFDPLVRGVLELGDGFHRLAIDAEDDVAGTHAGLRGRPCDVFDQ